MPLASLVIFAVVFVAVPIAVARFASSTVDAKSAWPTCFLIAEQRPDLAQLPRFRAGYPWSLSIVAAPLVLVALVWAIAALLELRALGGAWLSGELAAPLVLALFVTTARAIAASATAFGAFDRSRRAVLAGCAAGAVLDAATILGPIRLTEAPREDAIVALLSMLLSIAVAVVFVVEDTRRRDLVT